MTQPASDVSRAVLLYTGYGTARSPREDAAAVATEFGPERGAKLAGDVAELFREANAVPLVETNAMPLADAGRYVGAVLAQRHPELSDDAVAAISWKWTFDWR